MKITYTGKNVRYLATTGMRWRLGWCTCHSYYTTCNPVSHSKSPERGRRHLYGCVTPAQNSCMYRHGPVTQWARHGCRVHRGCGCWVPTCRQLYPPRDVHVVGTFRNLKVDIKNKCLGVQLLGCTAHTHTHLHTHVRMHAHTHTHTHTHTRYAHTYTCTHTHTYCYAHTHTHTAYAHTRNLNRPTTR